MRKLAVGSGSLATGLIISYFFYDRYLWPVITGILLICFLLSAFFSKKADRRLQIFLLMFSLGLIYFYIFNAAAEKKASDYAGDETFTAVVADFPEKYDNYSRVSVILYGKDRRCSAQVYDYYNNTAKLEPGDHIIFSASFHSMLNSGASAAESSISKGILLTGRLTSGITVFRHGISAFHIAKHISHAITDLIPQIFPNDTVSFLRALLLGRKTDLYSDNALYPALLRSGFMHTVAISGMHISFVAGFCLTLFGSNKRGALTSLCLIWLFVFMTGNTPSAARAGIMQTVLLMAPFFKRENDPLTSISFALSILLLSNPFAAGSISLQLSFSAVLGIILFSARINDMILSFFARERLKKILRYPAGIISASFSVMIFTLPLCTIHFGYVSFLSFLTNILALWAVPVCFCGAYLCLLLYLLLPSVAIIAANITAILCRYIFRVCSVISSIPYAVIPYEGMVTVLMFVLIYLLFILFGFSSYKAHKRILMPACISAFVILAYFLFFRLNAAETKATVTVLNVGQGECVAAFSENRTVVTDCGTSDYFLNPGIDCADYLFIRGQENIDALILTHLHSDHVNGVCHLMQLMDVANLFIPVNINRSDEMFLMIRETAELTGTRLVLVDADAAVAAGNIRVEMYPSYIYTDDNESCMAVKLDILGKSFLITGDGTYKNEMLLTEKSSIEDADVLVAGHHGSGTSSCAYFLNQINPRYSVISVGKDNQYGHPSKYVLERMQSREIEIFRTDLCGNVSFVIN